MKGIIILAILIALVGAGLWCGVMKKAMSEEGVYILTAMGNPDGKKIEFIVCAEMPMVFRNPPRLDKDMNPLWEEWLSEHYELRDEAGKITPGARVAHTMLIDERKIKSVPEFFVQFFLEQNKAYTLYYIPGGKGGTKFRYSFTAPEDTTPPERVVFTPVPK